MCVYIYIYIYTHTYIYICMHIKLVDKLISIQNISIVIIKILIQMYVYLLMIYLKVNLVYRRFLTNTIDTVFCPLYNLYYPSLWVSGVVKCKQNSHIYFYFLLGFCQRLSLNSLTLSYECTRIFLVLHSELVLQLICIGKVV